MKGKVYAYRILHKLLCQNETPVALQTLSHFYRVLLKVRLAALRYCLRRQD